MFLFELKLILHVVRFIISLCIVFHPRLPKAFVNASMYSRDGSAGAMEVFI